MSRTPLGGEATDDARESLGLRLRAARREAGLTLRDVARELGVSIGTWSAVENGRTRITDERLTAAASLFEADPTILRVPSTQENTHWREFPPLKLPPPLAGALDAFVELGYHGASIRDIAQRAGLSVAGVYYRRPTKQHLLVELLDLMVNDLLHRCRTARAEGDSPIERFIRLVECLALYHMHRRELGFIGASEMRSVNQPDHNRIAIARRMVQDMVCNEVIEGSRHGLMGTPLPREAARAVVTMCIALPQWGSAGVGHSSPQDVTRQYVDFGLDIVRATR